MNSWSSSDFIMGSNRPGYSYKSIMVGNEDTCIREDLVYPILSTLSIDTEFCCKFPDKEYHQLMKLKN